MFDIADQLLIRHSPFVPLCDVDEWMAKASLQGRSLKFSWIMAGSTLKKFAVTFKISKKGKKTKMHKEKPKVTYSMALVKAFLAAEKENRFCIKRFWPCTWKYYFCCEGKHKLLRIFGLKITFIVCFCNDLTHLFILSLIADALYDSFLGIVDPIFLFVNEIDFSLQ